MLEIHISLDARAWPLDKSVHAHLSAVATYAGQPKAKPDRKEARKQRQAQRKANQQDPERALNTTAPTPEELAAVGAGNPAPGTTFRRPKPTRKAGEHRMCKAATAACRCSWSEKHELKKLYVPRCVSCCLLLQSLQ